ncbi:L-lactate permease [Microvirga guangxiensis]|uniref:L-lactate permease n=1 Tax=Microvirga guangxiensis TaxID=549386 RepID=A0A1G5KAQ1_9HYPH|nr:L-lactate permease [Microvirga guangxiensis]SCY97138.1 lactate permease [Microvirga guangxiensis]
MKAVYAALPLALVLVLMIGRRWPAAKAGLAGLALATVLALTVFGGGAGSHSEIGAGGLLAGSALEALFTAATILWIIFPALAIYELQVRSGAFDVIRAGLAGLSGDPRIQALLVAWFFGLFMEGAAGFGTPVALAAPLLVSLGFSPVKAVALALIGHAVGVSFGAVGTPVLAQVSLVALSAADIAQATGLLHGGLGVILALFLVRLSGDGAPTGRQWGWGVVAAACFLAPYAALATIVGPELPTLGGALIGGACFVLILRWKAGPSSKLDWRNVMKAGMPYGIVLALILATRLLPGLREQLRSVEISWSLLGTFRGSMQPLYHAGTILLLGFVLGGFAQGRGLADLLKASRAALRRLAPVTLALVAMLTLSRLMLHARMIQELAEGAREAGAAWPLLAPAIGVLGTFVTGSATASNILFTEFQAATASALALPLATMVAAQGFGAAVGNIVCPHNIIAGAATVGLNGQEGEILTRTVLACIAYALAGGLLVLVLSS